MQKLKMHSPDLTAANIERLAALFPNCVTESRDENGQLRKSVDFDLLHQELSGAVVEGLVERYTLNWPGKSAAIVAANSPVYKTLRPCEAESVNFDTTKNLYIEGDNLEVLKLLQETYLGKVKMIYIDPPYNTGNDFIYDDDYAEDVEADFLKSSQKDVSGGRLVANLESNGRFHSDWLSMMYPRLKLARDLLSEDGVIFISIDDNEVTQLRKICDDVFGEKNFIAEIIWEGANKNDAQQIGIAHEYVLTFARNKVLVNKDWHIKKEGTEPVLKEVERLRDKFRTDYDSASKHLAEWFKSMKATPSFGLRRFHKIDANGAYKEDDPTAPGGRRFKLIHPKLGTVIPLRANRGWGFDQGTFDQMVKDNRIVFVSDTSIMVKRYLHEVDYITPPSVMYQPARSASERLERLMDQAIFDYPKDETVLMKFIEMSVPFIPSETIATSPVILDFFSGSATTAHAVMQLNAEDGANRRFIMVQLPEACDEKSEAYKAGYKNICEIGKERIRRAGQKIKEENATNAPNLDVGFRVFKVDSSNMKDVYYTPDAMEQSKLDLFADAIKEDRTAEDLLFQVFLDCGLDLALPVTKEKIEGKTIFTVDQNVLAACFASDIPESLIRTLAQRKPLKAVFLDRSFAKDSTKLNVTQIFKQLAPGTEVKTI